MVCKWLAGSENLQTRFLLSKSGTFAKKYSLANLEQITPQHEVSSFDNTIIITMASRQAGYTLIEDQLLSKSFIGASEDAIAGANQKSAVFKKKVEDNYKERSTAHLRHVQQQSKRGISASALQEQYGPVAAAGFSFPERNANSLYGRFKGVIAKEVMKFIGVVKTTPIESGTSKEDQKRLFLSNFEKRYGATFQHYTCYEYLSTKPKFTSFATMLDEDAKKKAAQRPNGTKKRKKQAEDDAFIKRTIATIKKEESDTSDVSKNSAEAPTDQATLGGGGPPPEFYNTLGSHIGTLVSGFAARIKQKEEKELYELLDSPDKKMIKAEKAKLYKAELIAKRRKLEEQAKDYTNTSD